jgi:hypothetical protein
MMWVTSLEHPEAQALEEGPRMNDDCYTAICPLGKNAKNYGKPQFLKDKSTINHHFQWLC